jgi:hypothetical protein
MHRLEGARTEIRLDDRISLNVSVADPDPAFHFDTDPDPTVSLPFQTGSWKMIHNTAGWADGLDGTLIPIMLANEGMQQLRTGRIKI